MFTPVIHDAVRAITPSARGELEITDAVQWLIAHGHHVHSHLITGYWKDTGRVRDMLECNRIVLESIETPDRRHRGRPYRDHRAGGHRTGCGGRGLGAARARS